MRKLTAVIPALVLLLAFVSFAQTQTKKAPAEMIFKAKMGNILFHHQQHIDKVKGDCKQCHDKLFKQDQIAPLAFKAPHKAAEEKQVSCGACHRPGGTAFDAAVPANCKKCHGTGVAK